MQKVLLCLDADRQPSVFDAVVAIDSGVDQLLRHGGVTPDQVEPLVHGAIFTRGPAELRNTAIFIGGSSVAAAEGLMAATVASFFGPMRVSVLMDAGGCNTTAAAAVLAAGRHATLGAATTAAVIGTGPVGARVAWMLASEGVRVRIISRTAERAQHVCESLAERVDAGLLSPHATGQRETGPHETSDTPLATAIDGAQVVVAAGPAGAEVLDESTRAGCRSLRVAIDLNAVPPAGVGGIEPSDKAVERDGQVHYGALGVGGTKMKIHRAAVRRLFETNDAVLDAAEVLAIGRSLDG